MKTSILNVLTASVLTAAWAFTDPVNAAESTAKATPEPNESAFTSLFDGETLTGWRIKPIDPGKSQWRVDKGKIVAGNDGGPGSDIWTEKVYRDYDLRLEFITLSEDYDTGVFLRGSGHQVQIGISGSLKKDMTACIYAPADQRGGYPGQTDKVVSVNRVGKWNTLRIVLQDKRIKTFLNDEPMVDYQGVAIKDSGPIGLQLHGNRQMKVAFRNIRVREL